ncbi:MAG: LysM peptidoglycan-binding domain-containing protein [Betaproteobacteria bacterium]|nr:LysM peptidoglycan-binding domain-containing protein [Betaproteobacteria bacterium]
MLLVLPWVAHAAGLGKLTIVSALGQPLLAEVDLISVQEHELAALKVRIASPEAFTKANVQYSPALIGVRLSIERRSDGRPYVKIISTRPVNEPFIDLLVELSWPQGNLVREYTALIDPPGYTPGAPIVQAVPPVELAPAVTLESQAPASTAPVEAKPAATAPAVARAVAPVRSLESQALAPTAPVKAKPAAKARAVTRAAAPGGAESKEYGPVKRGDTLSKIAARVKPEGVTLEQMLVSLYHANREAFGDNMNILYAGSMLRIPEEQQVVATAQSEAMKKVREQAAGKETPMEVLRLSKGELPSAGRTGNGKGAPREVTERLHVLEAELDALEKALTEANQLVVQLEQTVKNMRRRIEITEQLPGVAAAGTLPQPAPGAQPGAAPPVKGDQAAQPEPARAEPAKTGLIAEAPRSGEQAAPAAQPAAAGTPQQPKPKPTEIVQAPPDTIDQILAEPLYLAGGGLFLLLGGAGYWFARRRRTQVADVDPLVNDPLAEAELFLGLSQIYARRKEKAALEKNAHNVPTQTDGAVNSSLGATLGEMARALEVQDIVRDAGAAHAAAELTPAVAAPDSTLKFPDGMQPPAAPVKTPGAHGGEAVKADVTGDPTAPLGEMARALEAQDIARDAGAAHAAAETAPAVAAHDSTLNFPGEMQPPAAPGGDAVKAGVTGDPAVPKIGTIDFDAAPAPATPGDRKDSARDAGAAHAAAEAAPEFAAPDLTLEFPDGMQSPSAPGGDADKSSASKT